ncbi:Calcium/calmodulin-dependent protein kinase type II alpha chain, partial [Trichinella murrelli]
MDCNQRSIDSMIIYCLFIYFSILLLLLLLLIEETETESLHRFSQFYLIIDVSLVFKNFIVMVIWIVCYANLTDLRRLFVIFVRSVSFASRSISYCCVEIRHLI